MRKRESTRKIINDRTSGDDKFYEEKQENKMIKIDEEYVFFHSCNMSE